MAETTTDPDLIKALKQIRDGKPQQFVLVVSGIKSKLVVHKKILPSVESDTKKKIGGTLYKGRCIFQGGKLIFETAKDPPAQMLTIVKDRIKKDTGLTFTVDTRSAADAEAELAEDEGPGIDPEIEARFTARLRALTPEIEQAQARASPLSQEIKLRASEANAIARRHDFTQANALLDKVQSLLTQLAATAPPPPPPPPDGAKAAVLKRLNTLTGPIKAALAGPNASRVQALFVAVNGLMKNNDFAQAGKVLDELEPLVAGAAAAPAPTTPANSGAQFTERLKALLPEIQKAQGGASPLSQEIKLRTSEASVAARKQDFAQANALLDRVQELLKQVAASPAGSAASILTPQVAFTQSRLQWDGARKQVQADLQKLEKAILDTFHGMSKLGGGKLGQIAAAAKKLYTILDKLDARLIDKLDEALNAASPEKRATVHQEALKLVKEYKTVVNSDPLIINIDNNPFVAVNVRGVMLQTLNELEGKLAG